jgi:hypothetical protein
MIVESWPIDRPIEYARNARKITQAAVDKVASSIQEFGFRQAIVVDKDGVIIVGHVRLRAAMKLGMMHVPVHVAANLTPAQVKAYRLMDNRSHEEVEWDIGMLGAELLELNDLSLNMILTGFSPHELGTLLRDPLVDEQVDQAPPLPDVPVTECGDMWLLGDHKVLLGDATASAHVASLMGNEAADMIFTDPPYNVDYEGYTDERLKIQGDRMSAEQYQHFLLTSFQHYRGLSKAGASAASKSAVKSFGRRTPSRGASEGISFSTSPFFTATWLVRPILGTEINHNPRCGRRTSPLQISCIPR